MNNKINNKFEVKKNNYTFLIIIIVFLLLSLLGLTYYTFFMRDNKTNNKDNNNIKGKPLIYDSNEDTLCWYNGGNTLFNQINNLFIKENPSKDDIVKEAVYKYKIDKTFNDLSDENWQHYIISRALVFSQLRQTHHDKKYSDYSNVIYPKACTDNFSNEKSHMACQLGLSEEEIEVADKELFSQNEGGSCTYLIYKLDDIKQYIKNLFGSYGNIFDKSFSYIDENLRSSVFYDKNIDKIFIHLDSSPRNSYSLRYKINETKKDDILQIEYLDYIFEDGKVIDENGKTIDSNIDLEKFDISLYVNKLPHNEVTFKLENGNYKFESIIKK